VGAAHRIDRVIEAPGLGRMQVRTGAATPEERRAHEATFDRLVRDHEHEVLRALKQGALSWWEIMAAAKDGPVTKDLLLLRRPLLPTVLDLCRRTPRYQQSFRKLLRLAGLAPDAPVLVLRDLDWHQLALRPEWRSGSDWMHLRRAVSRFLRLLLGTLHHRFRLDVMEQFPTRPEVARMPDLPLGAIGELLEAVPPWARPVVLTLIGTGLRLGELERLRPHHLGPYTIAVPAPAGTKAARSRARPALPVDPRVWPAVEAAVPLPRSRKHFQRTFRAAVRRLGWDLTIHDLRHVFGQTLADARADVSWLMRMLRVQTPAIAMRYAAREVRRQDAVPLGETFGDLVADHLRPSTPVRPKLSKEA